MQQPTRLFRAKLRVFFPAFSTLYTISIPMETTKSSDSASSIHQTIHSFVSPLFLSRSLNFFLFLFRFPSSVSVCPFCLQMRRSIGDHFPFS